MDTQSQAAVGIYNFSHFWAMAHNMQLTHAARSSQWWRIHMHSTAYALRTFNSFNNSDSFLFLRSLTALSAAGPEFSNQSRTNQSSNKFTSSKPRRSLWDVGEFEMLIANCTDAKWTRRHLLGISSWSELFYRVYRSNFIPQWRLSNRSVDSQ